MSTLLGTPVHLLLIQSTNQVAVRQSVHIQVQGQNLRDSDCDVIVGLGVSEPAVLL